MHRNVDWQLLRRIAIPGVIGGVLGAYVLSNIDASVARPFVMAYLATIGLYLLFRAWRGAVEPHSDVLPVFSSILSESFPAL